MVASLGVSAEVRNTLAVPFSIGRRSRVDIKQSTWTAPCSAVSFFYGGRFNIHLVLIYNETWNVMSGVVQKVVSVHRASNFALGREGRKRAQAVYTISISSP